MYVCVVAWNIK